MIKLFMDFDFLTKIKEPARYYGKEFNIIPIKPKSLKFCLCYPDLYEIAHSALGIKILYSVINKHKHASATYCFAPKEDYVNYLKSNNKKLCANGTNIELNKHEILGFSLSYELLYTNILYMLELAGINVFSSKRKEDDPLIIAGGFCVYNFAPIENFFDIFVVGDGEIVTNEIINLYLQKGNKNKFLEDAHKIQGVFVPKKSKKVKKAFINDLNLAEFPVAPVMPNLEPVHNRAMLEVFRGCGNGCRFCEAGYVYRPIRYRSPKTISEQIIKLLKNCGYDEFGLGALSISDYPYLEKIFTNLNCFIKQNKINISLPSMRLDNFSKNYVTYSRINSLTFAPEAGTQRLRDSINKNLTEDDIMNSCKVAFSLGFTKLKLYFMLGLPTETQEDLDGIIELCIKIKNLFYRLNGQKKFNLSISVATFVPKPFTPFQWVKQADTNYINNAQNYLKSLAKKNNIKLSYHDIFVSQLECALSRGDEKLNEVIYNAYLNGCKFDGENLNTEGWKKAFYDAKIDIKDYLKNIDINSNLPWDKIDIGIKKDYFINEYKKSLEGLRTTKCYLKCSGCNIDECLYKTAKMDDIFDSQTNINQSLSTVNNSNIIFNWYITKIEKSSVLAIMAHLDFYRAIFYCMRRNNVILEYTEGFHPHALLKLMHPNSIGIESKSEYIVYKANKPFVSNTNEFIKTKKTWEINKEINIDKLIYACLYEINFYDDILFNDLIFKQDKIILEYKKNAEVLKKDIKPYIYNYYTRKNKYLITFLHDNFSPRYEMLQKLFQNNKIKKIIKMKVFTKKDNEIINIEKFLNKAYL